MCSVFSMTEQDRISLTEGLEIKDQLSFETSIRIKILHTIINIVSAGPRCFVALFT